MDRAPRPCQPKELGWRGPSLLREGSPCRRSPIKPPAGASSCSSWPGARCGPRAALDAFAGEGPAPGTKLPDPLMWAPCVPTTSSSRRRTAINVFDFEPVCRKNVPPAHFGYMASGIDDEVTLRANREGFLKFQLRPRRLIDVSKVDMSVEILGERISARPIVLAPIGGQSSFHADGEVAVARGAQGRQPSADSLDLDQHRRRGRHRRARRADLVPALRHQQVGGRQGARQARREGRLPGGRGHRRSHRRSQSGNPVPAAPQRHARMLRLPRPLEPAGEHASPRHVSGGRSLRPHATPSRRP